MTEGEYSDFARTCVTEAQAKQIEVAEIFASDGRRFDADRGVIEFLAADEPFVDAEVMCIGSWVFQSGSWMWAWAIESIPPPLRAGAERLKEIAAITGRAEFGNENAFVATEGQAWEFSAIACHHLQARAVYAAPFDDRRLYFLVRKILHRQTPEAMLVKADQVVQQSLRESKGAATLNLMRARFPELRPALVGADLRGVAQPWAHDLHAQILFDYDIVQTRQAHDLAGANLSGMRLDGAILRGVTLRDASFEGASLVEADLSAADLRGASFRNAFLNGANFTRAKLEGADFTGAELSRTLLADVDLSKATGLDMVAHAGPSEISFSTLVASGFEVTPLFLRKAGVSRGLIEDLANGRRFLAAYQTCFFSYSSKDAEFAGTLHRSLTEAGVRVFWDHLDVVPGEYLEDQITQAIRELKRILVVLSPASMASEWVEREIRIAWYHNRDSLLPIRLCPIEAVKEWTSAKGLPDIGSLFPVQDFSTWKSEQEYARAVSLVLKALSAGAMPAG